MMQEIRKKHILIKNLGYVFLYMIYVFLVSAGINALIALVCYLIGVKIPFEDFSFVFSNVSNSQFEIWQLIFFVLVLIPISEELLFRLILRDFKKNFPIVLIFCLVAMVSSFFMFNKLLSYLLFFYLLLLVLLSILFSNQIGRRYLFQLLFWSSIIVSSLSFLRSIVIFDVFYTPLYLMLLSFFAVQSYYLSLIRLKYGLTFSFLLNFCFALIPVVNYFFNHL